jgi:hypothetical protein
MFLPVFLDGDRVIMVCVEDKKSSIPTARYRGELVTEKTGRNNPCPCGSGLKYKRCCGKQEKFDFSIPEEFLTGTVLDEYMKLSQIVALYGEGMKFNSDGREYLEKTDDFEKRFKPGAPRGVTVTMQMSWTYYDLRFGKSLETVIERFLKDPIATTLREPGNGCLRHMSESYCAFYQVEKVGSEHISFRELWTEKEWIVFRMNELEDMHVETGQIWYTRFLGPSEQCYMYNPPYTFKEEVRDALTIELKNQLTLLPQAIKEKFPQDLYFRESCKYAVPFWANYFLHPDRYWMIPA